MYNGFPIGKSRVKTKHKTTEETESGKSIKTFAKMLASIFCLCKKNEAKKAITVEKKAARQP